MVCRFVLFLWKSLHSILRTKSVSSINNIGKGMWIIQPSPFSQMILQCFKSEVSQIRATKKYKLSTRSFVQGHTWSLNQNKNWTQSPRPKACPSWFKLNVLQTIQRWYLDKYLMRHEVTLMVVLLLQHLGGTRMRFWNGLIPRNSWRRGNFLHLYLHSLYLSLIYMLRACFLQKLANPCTCEEITWEQ